MYPIIGLFFSGIITGYLINYLADVLPVTRKLSLPTCEYCGSAFSIENYLTYGECQSCSAGRGIRPWLIIFLTTGLFIFNWFFPSEKIDFFSASVIISIAILIGVIDIEHRVVLYETSLVGGIVFIFIGLQRHGWASTIYGGLGGLLILSMFYMGGILFVKILSRIKKIEINEIPFGFGDVTLGTILGALIGFPGILIGLIAAVFLGGISSSIYLLGGLMIKKYKPYTAIPYAPFLLIGCLVLLFIR